MNKLKSRLKVLNGLFKPENLVWFDRMYRYNYPLCNSSFLIESKWSNDGMNKKLLSAEWNNEHILFLDDNLFMFYVKELKIVKKTEKGDEYLNKLDLIFTKDGNTSFPKK